MHEAGAVYGEFPKFDFGTYTFVACYRADCSGDGMEHRNSTSVTGGSMDGDGARGLEHRWRTNISIRGTSSASARRGSSRSTTTAPT